MKLVNSAILTTLQLSRGEICGANFIPSANGGNYFLPKSHKLVAFKEKTGFQTQLWQANVQTFFQMVFGSG